MKASFLPSEIARLVLGYLKEQDCISAYNEFLNTCKHLEECRGRFFYTNIMGLSLNDILDEYCEVHFYVNDFSLTDELNADFKKCSCLLEKVLFLTNRNDPPNAVPAKPMTPPRKSNISSKSSYRGTRVRHNSNNSNCSIETEKSHKYNLPTKPSCKSDHTPDENLAKSCEPLEIPIESTNLADLPGHKDVSNNTKESQNKGKEHIFNDFLHSIDNQNRNLKSCSKNIPIDKLPDCSANVTKPLVDNNEIDFRHALGLVKHTKSPEMTPKTPNKRKALKPKTGSSVRKLNSAENFQNESLDVTTITNALLDCPELHEKIADNINKVIDSSFNKSELLRSNSILLETFDEDMLDSKRLNDPLILDDDAQQIDNIIKSIVEKTEKEPLFDQLLNEVLAVSLENQFGSESDILSRPETSTPEKSSRSMSVVCSPASSFNSDNSDMAEQNRLKPNTRDIKPTNNLRVDKYDIKNKPILSNKNSVKFFKTASGGKKMELLRANYEHQDFKEKLSPVTDEENVSQTDDLQIPTKSTDQKVIILSNERVQTNLISSLGSIIICDTQEGKNITTPYVDQQVELNSINSVDFQAINTNIIVSEQSNIIPSQNTSSKQYSTFRIQNGVSKINEDGTLDSNFDQQLNSQLPVNKSSFITLTNIPHLNNSDSFQPVIYNSTKITGQNSQQNSMKTFNQNNALSRNLRQFRHKVTGKPPELVISSNKSMPYKNCQKENQISFENGCYIEAEVLEVPRIVNISHDTTNIIPKEYTMNLVKTENNPHFQNIFPKIQSLSDVISIMDTKIIAAPNYQLKSLVPLPESSTVVANVVESVSCNLPNAINISSVSTDSSKFEKTNRTVIENLDISHEIENLIIINPDDGCDTNIVLEKSNKNVDSEPIIGHQSQIGGICDKNLKTPNDTKTSKKMCLSTPTKKNSHVRVLDFSTPEKQTVTKRKALTSPKYSLINQAKIRKSSRLSTISTSKSLYSRSKACLFDPISEEKNSHSTAIKSVKSSKLQDSTIPKKTEMDKNKNNLTIKESMDGLPDDNNANTVEDQDKTKIKNKLKTENTNLKTIIPWDLNLRVLTSEMSNCDNYISKKTNRKTSKRKIMKISQKVYKNSANNSIEAKAKILEEELNKSCDTTLETSLSKSKTCELDKSVENKILNQSTSEQTSSTSVMNDLDLSTSLEDNSNKTLPIEKNTPKLNVSKLSSNHFKPRYSNIENKLSVREKKLKKTVDPIKDSAIPLGMKTNKSPRIKNSPFKVKFSSKSYLKKDSEKSDLKLTINSSSKTGKSDLSLNQITDNKSNIDKLKYTPDLNVPCSSQITPELPREYRCNPIDVKCNLSSLLETPIKLGILDLSMATPKFLSPGNNSEPISLVKMLGIPTPNFGNSPLLGISPRISGSVCTTGSYSSKKNEYSSGSSYYRPDELDKPDILDHDTILKKQTKKSSSPKLNKKSSHNVNIKTTTKQKKKNQPKSKTNKLKNKSPLKKLVATKKKVILFENDNNKSKLSDTSKSHSSYSSLNINSSIDDCKNMINSNIDNSSSRKQSSKSLILDEMKQVKIDKKSYIQTPRQNYSKKYSLRKVKRVNKEIKEDQQYNINAHNVKKGNTLNKKKSAYTDTVSVNENTIKFLIKKSSLSNAERLKKLTAKKITKPTFPIASTPNEDKLSKAESKILPPKDVSISKSKRKSSTPRKIDTKEHSQLNECFNEDTAMESIKFNKSTMGSSGDINKKNESAEIKKPDSKIPEIRIQEIKNAQNTNSESENNVKIHVEESDQLKPNFQPEGKNTFATSETQDLKEIVSSNSNKSVIVPVNNKSNTSLKEGSSTKEATPKNLNKCKITKFKEKSHLDAECFNKSNIQILPSTDTQKTNLDVSWSPYEGTMSNFTFNNTDKKKRKLTSSKSPNDIDLHDLAIDVDVFDVSENVMRVIFLKTTDFSNLIEMSPDKKYKKKTELNSKLSLNKNVEKSISEKPRSGLQMLIEEMSDSTTESLSPVENAADDDNKKDESYTTDIETANAVKTILLVDENISTSSPNHNIPSNIDTPNQDDLEEKTITINKVNDNDKSIEKVILTNQNDVNTNDTDNLMDFVSLSCSENKSEATEKVECVPLNLTKRLNQKNPIAFKDIDIEEVLRKLHGH